MEEARRQNIFFLAVIALFLAYCIPIILQGTKDFRMINTFDSDEGTAATILSRMINESSLYPRGYYRYTSSFFHYGALYFYINYFFMWVIKTVGSLKSVSDQIIIISLRLTNTIFAVLSGWGVFILSRKIYNLNVAMLACLFLITTHNVIFWSTTAHPDILQMFLIIISIYFSILLFEGILLRMCS